MPCVLRLLLGPLLAMLPACASAAEVRAWLDRDSARLGETVTLNVEASGSGSDTPDFSALSRDFEQLGTSSSSQVSVVNGATTAKQLWAVGLQPRHEGRIEIAPIAVGGATSNALSLTVLPAPVAATTHAGDEVFVEMQAEPDAPYVQQQVRLTVALYFAVNLADGNLDEPHAEGAVVQKLGQDRNYQAQRGGRSYRVIERHYALVPQRSGALSVPALRFRGRAVGSDPAAMFFGRGREIAASSDALALQVRPRPAGAGSGPWLPAQSLDYSAQGPDAGTAARVGEPLTLTLDLRAQGLGFEQLPELTLPALDGADVYPDKPVTRTRDDGSWLLGESERKFAIVPKRAGTLHLPELRLDWWDTAHDRLASVTVPARDIAVAPAAAATPPPSAPPQTAAAPSATTPAAGLGSASAADLAPQLAALRAQLRRWQLATAVLLAALGLTGVLALWTRARRKDAATPPVPTPAPVASRAAREVFLRAAGSADAAALERHLLAWARAEGQDLPHLQALASRIDDAAQRAAIAALQRARYGSGGEVPDAQTLQRAFRDGLAWHRAAPATFASSPLPRLYPP